MRNTILLFLANGVLLPLSAQHTFSEKETIKKENGGHVGYSLRGGAATGTAYYLETFDDGLGQWTPITPQGIVNWKWTGTGPGPTPSFYAVPPLACIPGWAILDDDHDGYPGHTGHASLISPSIDLSGAPLNLKLQFDQYFQEFHNDNTYVGISTDGGQTWNEVEINQGVGRTGRPNPETVILNISSWVAADPSNVKIRFRYMADWSYGWQIDNVGIYEPPPHELVLEQGSISHIPDGESHGRIPASQIGEDLYASAQITNAGSLDLSDVMVTIEIRNEDDELVHASATDPVVLAPWETVTITHVCEIPPPENGNYRVTFTATSAEQEFDAELVNNTSQQNFNVNEALYSIDGVGIHPEGIELLSFTGTDSFEDAEDGLSLINRYMVSDPIQVHGIQIGLHGSSEAGGFLYATLMDPIDLINGQMNITNGETPIHDLTQADIDAGVVNLLFSAPVLLGSGVHYATVVLNSLAGDAHIRVIDDLSIPRSPLSSLIHVQNDNTYNNGNAHAIRLILDPSMVAVSELSGQLQASIRPNPTVDRIVISAPNAINCVLEIRDLIGALVHRATFSEQTTVDLGHLAPAVYFVNLKSTDAQITLRVVKEQ